MDSIIQYIKFTRTVSDKIEYLHINLSNSSKFERQLYIANIRGYIQGYSEHQTARENDFEFINKLIDKIDNNESNTKESLPTFRDKDVNDSFHYLCNTYNIDLTDRSILAEAMQNLINLEDYKYTEINTPVLIGVFMLKLESILVHKYFINDKDTEHFTMILGG